MHILFLSLSLSLYRCGIFYFLPYSTDILIVLLDYICSNEWTNCLYFVKHSHTFACHFTTTPVDLHSLSHTNFFSFFCWMRQVKWKQEKKKRLVLLLQSSVLCNRSFCTKLLVCLLSFVIYSKHQAPNLLCFVRFHSGVACIKEDWSEEEAITRAASYSTHEVSSHNHLSL